MYDPVEAIRETVNSYLQNRTRAGLEAICIEFATVKAHLDNLLFREQEEIIKKLRELADLQEGGFRNILYGQIDALRPYFEII